MRISGRATSSKPMLTLLISPPLMPRFPTSPIWVFRMLSIPNFSMTSSTNATFSTSGRLSGSLNLAAKRSASDTVSVGGSKSCCGTNPILGEEPVPWWETLPVTIPPLDFLESISISVVFPAPTRQNVHRVQSSRSGRRYVPLGPRIAIISPGLTRPETLSRITLSSVVIWPLLVVPQNGLRPTLPVGMV